MVPLILARIGWPRNSRTSSRKYLWACNKRTYIHTYSNTNVFVRKIKWVVCEQEQLIHNHAYLWMVSVTQLGKARSSKWQRTWGNLVKPLCNHTNNSTDTFLNPQSPSFLLKTALIYKPTSNATCLCLYVAYKLEKNRKRENVYWWECSHCANQQTRPAITRERERERASHTGKISFRMHTCTQAVNSPCDTIKTHPPYPLKWIQHIMVIFPQTKKRILSRSCQT